VDWRGWVWACMNVPGVLFLVGCIALAIGASVWQVVYCIREEKREDAVRR
jgi:hypothetical protein